MELLTAKQKTWLVRRTIKENRSYMFPRFGFTIYSYPNYISGEYVDTNPFTKSLDNQRFLVKEKVDGFLRGNFQDKPNAQDMYLSEDELSRRDLIEILFLIIVSFAPMTICNLAKWCVDNIKNK